MYLLPLHMPSYHVSIYFCHEFRTISFLLYLWCRKVGAVFSEPAILGMSSLIVLLFYCQPLRVDFRLEL